MPRLVYAPLLPIVSQDPLSGPEVIKASSGTSIGKFTQTVATFSALWRWQFGLGPMRGLKAREYRGWVLAQHGGANPSIWTFHDPDRITLRESGLLTTRAVEVNGIPWENGKPWGNGMNWSVGYDFPLVAEAASKGATVVKLADEHWGHRLDMGSIFGFQNNHFGMYAVTEVIDAGEYRIWPPLRRAIEITDKGSLNPSIAFRLESSDSAPMPRGLQVIDGASVTMVEVPDAELRKMVA